MSVNLKFDYFVRNLWFYGNHNKFIPFSIRTRLWIKIIVNKPVIRVEIIHTGFFSILRSSPGCLCSKQRIHAILPYNLKSTIYISGSFCQCHFYRYFNSVPQNLQLNDLSYKTFIQVEVQLIHRADGPIVKTNNDITV